MFLELYIQPLEHFHKVYYNPALSTVRLGKRRLTMKTNVSDGFPPTWTHPSRLALHMSPKAEEDVRMYARKATPSLRVKQLGTNTVVAAAVEVDSALRNFPGCLVLHHSRPWDVSNKLRDVTLWSIYVTKLGQTGNVDDCHQIISSSWNFKACIL